MSSLTNSGLCTVSLSEKIDAKRYHLQNLKEKVNDITQKKKIILTIPVKSMETMPESPRPSASMYLKI